MVERGADQADGLRRMFSEARARVIEIAAGESGVGRTSVAVNLGAALARMGRNALLVDVVACAGRGRALRYLGIAGEHSGASTTRAARASALTALELVRAPPTTHTALTDSSGTGTMLLREAVSRDYVLVNSAGAERVMISADGCREVLVVLSQAASSITGAYALVKRLAYEAGACRFYVVVNRAESAPAALRIFRNFDRVARSYLDVRPELLGHIPFDPCIEHAAAHGRSVVDWNPKAPAARALRELAEAIGRGTAAHSPELLAHTDFAAPYRLAL